MDWKDIGIRAGKTFLQAFVGILLLTEFTSVVDFVDPAILDQAFVAGSAALLSFINNLLINAAD